MKMPICGKLRNNVKYILFGTDSILLEFVMGVFSILTGVWLFTAYAHYAFSTGAYQDTPYPHLWGTILIIAGTLKLFGVNSMNIWCRWASCILASFSWCFITLQFYHYFNYNQQSSFGLIVAALMALLNASIVIRLRIRDTSDHE